MTGTVSAPRESPPRRSWRRKGGVVVPNSPRWYQRLGAWLILGLVRAVAATVRFRWENRSGLYEGKASGPVIYCIWHNRLALCMTIYEHYKPRTGTPGMAAMVSASKDGAFLAAILEGFHVRPVRGSSSRRGPQALLELTTWAERGFDLAITPDGPRGPCYVVQEGVMSLAQLTGLPVVPVSYSLGWKIRAKSWDRFQVPLPFSRCEVIVEKPIHVPREATDEEREGLRRELEATLKRILRD